MLYAGMDYRTALGLYRRDDLLLDTFGEIERSGHLDRKLQL